jgi:hypothetical protein
VVVHEADQVEPLVFAQEEGKDIALPELIGLGSLEASWRMFARSRRCLRVDESGFVQDGAHLCLAHAESFEARQHVADSSRPVVGVRFTHLDDCLPLRGGVSRHDVWRGPALAWDECVETPVLVEVDPRVDGRDGDTE